MSAVSRIPRSLILASLVAMALGACAGGEPGGELDAPSANQTPGVASPIQPGPGGTVINVEMLTDDQGNNVFRPSDIVAKEGDVLRFTLVSGVHNVHFVADSNRAASGLPKASDMLQAPGQTVDVLLDWEEGRYFFQCDPHALLGMVGHVTIKEAN
jgi:plastocyanin